MDSKSKLERLRYIYIYTGLFCLFYSIRGGWNIYYYYHVGKFDEIFVPREIVSSTDVVISERADLIYISLCFVGQLAMIALNFVAYTYFDVERYFESIKYPGYLFGRDVNDIAIGRMLFVSTIVFALITIFFSNAMMDFIIKRMSN
jgi:hypothetical protein